MQVKCYNKKCLHEWNYTGGNKKFICCPKCRFKRLLFKCKEFYIKEHTKKDILKDIPKDIPTKKPIYTKVIERPQTEFFDEDSNSTFISPEETKKICEIHNLPASYDSFDRKWVCDKCIKIETPNQKPLQDNLGEVRDIEKDISIRVIQKN